MLEHVAAAPAGEDLRQRLALARVAALIQEERERPRRALDVVAVARGEDDAHSPEIDPVGFTLLDRPRERELADSVRRAAAGPPIDPPARARRIAIAGLEVGPADTVRHG